MALLLEVYNRDWCRLVSEGFASGVIARDQMEKFLIDIIVAYLHLDLPLWDPERMDKGMMVSDLNERIITKTGANDGGWDWKSASELVG